jgi:hypothetical protein
LNVCHRKRAEGLKDDRELDEALSRLMRKGDNSAEAHRTIVRQSPEKPPVAANERTSGLLIVAK